MVNTITRGVFIGLGLLAGLLVVAAISNQIGGFEEIGGLILLILLLISATIAKALHFPMSDGVILGAFPNSILGWVVGVIGTVIVFIIIGLIISFIINYIRKLKNK